MLLSSLLMFLVNTKLECRNKLCGMTVAPIIPIAINSSPLFSNIFLVGIYPFNTLMELGLEKPICTAKHTVINKTNVATKASIIRKDLPLVNMIINTSRAVIHTPVIY